MKAKTRFLPEEIRAFGTSVIVSVPKNLQSKAEAAGIIMPDEELTRSLTKKKEISYEGEIPQAIKDLNDEIFVTVFSAGQSAKENGIKEGDRVLIHPSLLSNGLILPYKDLDYHLILFDLHAIIATAVDSNQTLLS